MTHNVSMSYGNPYQNLTNAMLNSLVPTVTPKRQIVSVNGVQEAKNFTLERGENIILMDSNADVIYIKSVDDLGKSSLKVFSCMDITNDVLNESTTSIDKKDFDRLSKELSDLKKLVTEMAENEYNARKSEPKKSNT